MQNDSDGKILELLNDENLEALKKNQSKSDIIRYVLDHSKFKEEFLQNDTFLDILLECNKFGFRFDLHGISFETCNRMLKRYIELGSDSASISTLFVSFSESNQLRILDNWEYSIDILYDILNNDNKYQVTNKIINNYDIDLSSPRINLYGFFNKTLDSAAVSFEARNLGKKEIESISIPSRMINEDLCKRLWNEHDIFNARATINLAQHTTDVTLVNDYFKKQEEVIINDCTNNDLVFPYQELYMLLSKREEVNKLYEKYDPFIHDYDEQKKAKIYENILSKLDYIIEKYWIDNRYNEIHDIYYKSRRKGNVLEDVYEQLKKLSDRAISNYIIDYSFEENYHNITIDMQELLRMYRDNQTVIPNDKAIPRERLELYEQIINIDHLSREEKKELHNRMKNINIMELFYDDMSMARKFIHETIKQYSLNKESLQRYKDDELSKKYGVDVFKMGDEPFFGIVKVQTARGADYDQMPTGHSFSLVGNDCVAIFSESKSSDAFLYDANDLNPDQIVHVFPFDSYTYYQPFKLSGRKASTHVNRLLKPDEVLKEAKSRYTELLILEKGTIPTEIDKDVPKLKKIALYCIDKITEKDIEEAERMGLGIILVSSKKYIEDSEISDNSFIDDQYYDGIINTELYESRRP